MAFFNLTQMGSQNPIKRITPSKEEGSIAAENPSKAAPAKNDGHERELPSLRSLQYNYGTYETSYQGSHKKFDEMRTKHQRNVDGPLKLYQYPAVSSQNYGWFIKYGHQPWTQNEQHVHVNSPMTRFVDEMSTSNKGFSLF